MEDTPKTKKEQFLDQLTDQKLLGQVICWRAEGPHPYANVKKALQEADLDEAVARERLPQHAFARAARSLSDDRVIDIIKTEKDEIVFQFTKKALDEDSEEGGHQWSFYKEAKVRLDKTTGKITCVKFPELEKKAQQELDKHLQQRTTNDISLIIQKQFERNADLIPFRDQGGVYIVPIESRTFLDKIDNFLQKLGGSMKRLPIPAGDSKGDATFQSCLEEYLKDIVDRHKKSVSDFTPETKPTAAASIAERINATKLKVEAYAHYLKDKSEGLLEMINETRTELVGKIQEMTRRE